MTQDQAVALIDYLETMEAKTDHQANMTAMKEIGWDEPELHEACRALGVIAQRDYGIL